MYSHTRTKEPEINTHRTSSMATWNTGLLGAQTMEKEQHQQLHSQNPQQFAAIDKSQRLMEVVNQYQEAQCYNYSIFLRELSALGYCTMPMHMPGTMEIITNDEAKDREINENVKTYGDYKRKMGGPDSRKRNNDTSNDFDFGNLRKKSKTDDWDDEGTSQSTQNNDAQRKNSNSINRMQSGWSDDESEQRSAYRNNDRSNDYSNDRNNDKFGERRSFRGRGGGGFRGNGRGGRGGRGNGRFGNRSPRERFDDAPKNNSVLSGWSDDESKPNDWSDSQTNVKSQKPEPADDWGDDWDNQTNTKSIQKADTVDIWNDSKTKSKSKIHDNSDDWGDSQANGKSTGKSVPADDWNDSKTKQKSKKHDNSDDWGDSQANGKSTGKSVPADDWNDSKTKPKSKKHDNSDDWDSAPAIVKKEQSDDSRSKKKKTRKPSPPPKDDDGW